MPVSRFGGLLRVCVRSRRAFARHGLLFGDRFEAPWELAPVVRDAMDADVVVIVARSARRVSGRVRVRGDARVVRCRVAREGVDHITMRPTWDRDTARRRRITRVARAPASAVVEGAVGCARIRVTMRIISSCACTLRRI